MSKQDGAGTFITGLAIGGALGTIIGLLIAPRTGKETRKVLEKSADALPKLAEDLATTLKLQSSRLSAETIQNWEETLERLQQAIAAGQEASQIEKRRRESASNGNASEGKLN